MSATLIVSLGLPVAATWLLLRGLFARGETGRPNGLIEFGLAILLALAVVALFAAMPLLVPGSANVTAFVEPTFWMAVAALGWRNGPVWRSPLSGLRHTLTKIPAYGTITVAVLVTAMLAGFVARQVRTPYGDSDGTATWNLHARAIHGAPDDWQGYFGGDAETGVLYAWHPDYPLLWPSIVARCWRSAGSDLVPASSILTGLFLAGTILVVCGTVAEVGGPLNATLVGLALLGNVCLVKFAGAQYADVPFAGFVVGTLCSLTLAERRARSWPLDVVAGLLAGAAAWTKNEGLLFVGVLGIALGVRLLFSRERAAGLRRAVTLFAAAAPCVLLVLWFKSNVAAEGDLVAGQSPGQTLNRLTDPARYGLIAASFGRELWALVEGMGLALVIHAVVVGPNRGTTDRGSSRFTLAIVGLMLAGYVGVYVTTPYDLQWHLNTSLRRLLMQLWPAFLVWYGTSVANPLRSSLSVLDGGTESDLQAEWPRRAA